MSPWNIKSCIVEKNIKIIQAHNNVSFRKTFDKNQLMIFQKEIPVKPATECQESQHCKSTRTLWDHY